jgi:uncharacterized protein (TIGR02145 family)
MYKQLLILLIFFLLSAGRLTAQDFDFDEIQSGTVTDNEGNEYSTVLIGDTWWMAENLRTKHYNDGTEILQMTKLIDSSDEENDWGWWTMIGRWAYPEFKEDNFTTYGLLYSQAAANDNEHGGVCPDGWSLSDTTEWWTLARVIVGRENVIYLKGTRNTPDGGTETYYEASQATGFGRYLKSDNGDLWTFEPTIGQSCNQAKMNIVPSGKLNTQVEGFGELAHFWTSNYVHSDGSGQGRRYFEFDYETHDMEIKWNHNANMQCVRCTKAADPTSVSETDILDSGDIKLWPNPASDYLMIYVSKATIYKIYSLNGQLLKTGKLTTCRNRIDLSCLPRGIYLIKAGKHATRILVQ